MEEEDAYDDDGDEEQREEDRILELECELSNAWSTVDQLSDQYVAMWDKLEKLEILLLMQRNVISQLSCIVQEPTAIDRHRHRHSHQLPHHDRDPCHWTPIRQRRRPRMNELSFTNQQQQPSGSRRTVVSFDTSFDSSVYHPEPPPPMPPLHADSASCVFPAGTDEAAAECSASDEWLFQGTRADEGEYSGGRERTTYMQRRGLSSLKNEGTSLLPEEAPDPKKGLKRQGNIMEHLPLLPRQDEEELMCSREEEEEEEEESDGKKFLADPPSPGILQAASFSTSSFDPAVDINQILPLWNPEMDHTRGLRRKIKILRRKSIEEVEDEEIEPRSAFEQANDPEEQHVFLKSVRKARGQVRDLKFAPALEDTTASPSQESAYSPHVFVGHLCMDEDEEEIRRRRRSIIHDDLDQDRISFRTKQSPSSSPVRDRTRSPSPSLNQMVQRQDEHERLEAKVLVPVAKVDQITAEAGEKRSPAGGQVVSFASSLLVERRPSSGGPEVLVTEAAIPFHDHPSTSTGESRRSMLIPSPEVPSCSSTASSTAATATTIPRMSASSSRSSSVTEQPKNPDPISSLNQSLLSSLTSTVSRGYQNVLSLQARQQQLPHQIHPQQQQQSRRLSSGSSLTSSLGGFFGGFKNVPFVASSAVKPQTAANKPPGHQYSLPEYGSPSAVKANDRQDVNDSGSSILVMDDVVELTGSRNESSSQSATDGNALSRNPPVQYLMPCDGSRRKGSRGEDQFLTTPFSWRQSLTRRTTVRGQEKEYTGNIC